MEHRPQQRKQVCRVHGRHAVTEAFAGIAHGSDAGTGTALAAATKKEAPVERSFAHKPAQRSCGSRRSDTASQHYRSRQHVSHTHGQSQHNLRWPIHTLTLVLAGLTRNNSSNGAASAAIACPRSSRSPLNAAKRCGQWVGPTPSRLATSTLAFSSYTARRLTPGSRAMGRVGS